MRKTFLFLLGIIYFHTSIIAQGEETGKLQSNPVLQNFEQEHPHFDFNKQGDRSELNTRATLTLPFFDDFTFHGPLPNRSKWTDPYVYINNHFAILPPSYGVASFDNLNWNGAPYRGIDGNYYTASDTLTSENIDLSAPSHKVSDSIYLSFFLEPQGFDPDPLFNNPVKFPQDSFIVYFYAKDSTWQRMAAIAGKGLHNSFKQYFVGIKSAEYLHDAFRFRFINFSRQTGQANHWHLDYVYMNKLRSVNDTNIADFAIVYEGMNLLKNYYSMPYKQFDPSKDLQDSTRITIKNLFSAVKLPFCEHFYNDSNFNLLKKDQNTFYNVPGSSFGDLTFPVWKGISSLGITGKYIIKRQWRIVTPNDNERNNDTITHHQVFDNYLAYDDGSAEACYGLTGNLGAFGGKVAQKFNLNKSDSLWGISLFFAKCSTETSKKPFKLAVWRSVTPGTGEDILLKTINVSRPAFLPGINHFVDVLFDSALALDSGSFYIGWIQTAKDTFFIGQDMNYAQWSADSLNRNAYYQVQGKWYQSNKVKGALMMRPYIGADRRINVFLGSSTPANLPLVHDANIYPNPTNGLVQIEAENGQPVDVRIYQPDGRELANFSQVTQIDLSNFNSGTYLLQIRQQGAEKPMYKTIVVK
jgi:hypothetical protein